MRTISELLEDIGMHQAEYDLILGDISEITHKVKVNPSDFIEFVDQNETRMAIDVRDEIPGYFIQDRFDIDIYYRLINITSDGDLTFTIASVTDVSPTELENIRWKVEYFKQEIKTGPCIHMKPMFIDHRGLMIMDCRGLTEDEVTEQVARLLFLTGASRFKIQGTGEFYSINKAGVFPYVTFDAIDDIESVRTILNEIIHGYIDLLKNIK